MASTQGIKIIRVNNLMTELKNRLHDFVALDTFAAMDMIDWNPIVEILVDNIGRKIL